MVCFAFFIFFLSLCVIKWRILVAKHKQKYLRSSWSKNGLHLWHVCILRHLNDSEVSGWSKFLIVDALNRVPGLCFLWMGFLFIFLKPCFEPQGKYCSCAHQKLPVHFSLLPYSRSWIPTKPGSEFQKPVTDFTNIVVHSLKDLICN